MAGGGGPDWANLGWDSGYWAGESKLGLDGVGPEWGDGAGLVAVEERLAGLDRKIERIAGAVGARIGSGVSSPATEPAAA